MTLRDFRRNERKTVCELPAFPGPAADTYTRGPSAPGALTAVRELRNPGDASGAETYHDLPAVR